MPIRLLEPQVVARIAAGEVVERPASVVKELVENSLDAGSTQIVVEISRGGMGLIRITDNGSGIPASELELAFQRHATSKICGVEDLDSISSLGFRGEALASIAVVAQIDAITCAVGESAGSHIILDHSSSASRSSQARSQGTTITVRGLFRNVPARLKFMKSAATENSRIADVISRYALAFPEVKFVLTSEGRTTLRSPGTGRLPDAIMEVYGLDTARGMLPLSGSEGEWKSGNINSVQVTGMVGSPAVSRGSRDFLSFYVNRRWIASRALIWAVEEAYHGLLMQSKHPVAVINISLPPGEVDVNIHPAKTEVKFQNEHIVISAVQKAVRRALIESAPVPRIEDVSTSYNAPGNTAGPQVTAPVYRTQVSLPIPPVISRIPSLTLPALRLLGQMARCYIVAEGPDGLYLIDQHAAHERVQFEKITQQHSMQKIEVQGLLEPAIFEVSAGQEIVLQQRAEGLVRFGFALEAFGDRTYLVRTVPAMLDGKDWVGALRELVDSDARATDWTERIAATIACHSAIRAGQVLADSEMRELLGQLEQAALPNTCPHGRPTMIHLTAGQIEKEFGRQG